MGEAGADRPSPGKLPWAQSTADAQRAWGAWSRKCVFMRVLAPASINLIQLSLRAGLGPEGCAWYPAALGSHVRGGQSWRQASRTPLGGECAIQR